MRWTVFLAVALMATSGGAAKSVKTERISDALEFSYEWPVKVQSISGLVSYFKADMEKAFREARADASEDVRRARANHYPFRQHSYAMSWDVEGETARLVSLEGDYGWDANGAHPNSSTKALLWDRQIDRQAVVAGLFTNAAGFQALTRTAYCKALDAERLRRREGERLEGEFSQCPAYKELSIVLVDRNHNRRFDHVLFVAPPYVAGPYVEGDYEISLPVTANFMSAIKPPFRASFEVQRQ